MTMDIDSTEARRYYQGVKNKERICLSVMALALVIWGADITFDLGLPNFGVGEVAVAIVLVAAIIMLVTRCPACKRFGFKGPKCSACKFPLSQRSA